MIRRLVHAFYDRARADPMLAPVFARITDWPNHLERMCAFWSSMLLATSRYDGRPMPAHAPLPIGASHFDQWLALFADTARDVCPPNAAALFAARARIIGNTLESALAMSRGTPLGPGERLASVAGDGN